MAPKRLQSKGPILTASAVDEVVLSLQGAIQAALGVPTFDAGSRSHVRELLSVSCPLTHSDYDSTPVDLFRAQYITSHFLDSYLFAVEVEGVHLLQEQATAKLLATVADGYRANEEMLPQNRHPVLSKTFDIARKTIARILGELSPQDVFLECKHGPNSTATIPYRDAYLDVKYRDFSGTEDAQWLFFEHYLPWDTNLLDELKEDASYKDVLPTPLKGNKISFVPKRWNKLRTMAAEGTLNQFFQLGTGRLIAKLLARHTSIDLATQPDVHRSLAVLASKYPEIQVATLDWSEASDRQWIEIFAAVLPPCWFQWLMWIRSPIGLIAGKPQELPMMGTMGCGFTFPLQTLLYYALLDALATQFRVPALGISVFGDDCIVPVDLVPFVHWLAEKLHWRLNMDKSFWDGGFRESCGMDAFHGIQVRPFRVKRPENCRSRNQIKAWVYITTNGSLSQLAASDDPLPILLWCQEMHRLCSLGQILVVPPRFPDFSGIRWDSPTLPLEVPSLPAMMDVHGGVHFRGLSVSHPDRDVWEFPYYHTKLRGHDYPEDWKASILRTEVPPSPLNKRGKGPLRNTTYRSTKQHVHTWSYFLPC